MKKHTIYFIGGSARVGKTTIALKLTRRKHLIPVSTDGIRMVIRNVLIGEPYVSVNQIEFRAKATIQRPGNLKRHKIVFQRKTKNEEELAWVGVAGLVKGYDFRKNRTDVLVEGVAVTPERVHTLKLKNLRVRAVFIGYNNESHTESILRYSKKHNDWVQTWIKERGGDDVHVKTWVRKEIVKSAALKKQAKRFGYGYFDVTERPFKEHVRAVLKYLS